MPAECGLRKQELKDRQHKTIGEGGIVLPSYSQRLLKQQFESKSLNILGLMLFWMVVVICGCLATSGILSSTDLAHPNDLMSGSLKGRMKCILSRSKKSLPGGGRNGIIGASYARYSSDNQDDSSIDQQRRKCRDQAEINRHTIRQEYEFRDDAVSGTRIDREGFQAMLTAAREGLFDVLYIENLSRLAREFVISMPALKELVYVLKVRVISTSESMDTAVDG